MKALILNLILSVFLSAQVNEKSIHNQMDSLLLTGNFTELKKFTAELNLLSYMDAINGILHLEELDPSELEVYYKAYLSTENNFKRENVGVEAETAFKSFVNAFNNEQYIRAAQSYKTASFFKKRFQDEKLSVLISNMEHIQACIESDQYEEAGKILKESQPIAAILKGNDNYSEHTKRFEKIKSRYSILESRSAIHTDFEYMNSHEQNLSLRLSFFIIHNGAGSGRSVIPYHGEKINYRNMTYTYEYEYESKVGTQINLGLTYKIFEGFRIGAFYDFYSFLEGKSINFLVYEYNGNNGVYDIFDPERTYHKINANGVRLSLDYSLFKEWIINPVIGIDYYYGIVSYRGPLGLMRSPYPATFYGKAAFDDQIYSGLDGKLGFEIFYSKVNNLFLEFGLRYNLISRELAVHEQNSSFGMTFGYYFF